MHFPVRRKILGQSQGAWEASQADLEDELGTDGAMDTKDSRNRQFADGVFEEMTGVFYPEESYIMGSSGVYSTDFTSEWEKVQSKCEKNR